MRRSELPRLYFVLVLLGASSPLAAVSCSSCHPAIAKTYRQTGMGRSFFALRPENKVEDFSIQNHYYHRASDTHYEMIQRGDRLYQRRYQIGYNGKEANVEELQIDFVMGSGDHARTYLHRTGRASFRLDAEKGGSWAMSPGYDTALHPGSRRPIGYDCMFCHNAYPSTPKRVDRFGDPPIFTGVMPEGIDYQRCHGSGDQHIAEAQVAGAKVETIRRAILNPSRLSLERQMDVCMQCHLQTHSFRPTLDFKRYGRSYFSYRPSEPLSSFMLYFDVPDKVPGSRFQITGSVYRLRQSACFLKSQGRLQCTTCHNPHEVKHGWEASAAYNAACQSCHTSLSAQHTSAKNCIDCHMSKQRTQDVVNVTMTDHYIQRRPVAVGSGIDVPSGPAIPYYPSKAPADADSRLASTIAQMRIGGEAKRGISLVSEHPDPYFELGEARLIEGQPKEAVPLYREALRRDPRYFAALLSLGSVLGSPETLKRAIAAEPTDARPWAELGQTSLELNTPEAATAFRQAIALDPGLAQPHIGLGVLAMRSGAAGEAKAEFREAIRVQPFSGEAHAKLATLLNLNGDLPQAAWEFERAVQVMLAELWTRLNYGALLYTMHRTDDARRQAEAAVTIQGQSAQAHHLLGNVLEQKGSPREALYEYQEAVRLEPLLSRAQLDFGAVLAQTGDRTRAAQHLKIASTSDDANVRRIALQLLEEISKE